MWPKVFSEFVRGPALAGRRVMVAVSGGIDSVTLLHGLVGEAKRAELTLCAAHVNHGLRGPESDADETFVAALCERLDVPFRSARVDPESIRLACNNRTRPSPQAAARRVRYDALEELRDVLRAEVVATAHTLDDQAETVLLRLMRGCAPDALSGISPVSNAGRLVRPLLGVSREEIEECARAGGLQWREDASNRDERYRRNRLRREWLPGLARDFNPQLLRAVARLADAQRDDSAWMTAHVAELEPEWIDAAGGDQRWRLRGWATLPKALARRIIERAVIRAGGGADLSRTHIERIHDFVCAPERHEGGRTLQLPSGICLVRESKCFSLRPTAEPTGPNRE